MWFVAGDAGYPVFSIEGKTFGYFPGNNPQLVIVNVRGMAPQAEFGYIGYRHLLRPLMAIGACGVPPHGCLAYRHNGHEHQDKQENDL